MVKFLKSAQAATLAIILMLTVGVVWVVSVISWNDGWNKAYALRDEVETKWISASTPLLTEVVVLKAKNNFAMDTVQIGIEKCLNLLPEVKDEKIRNNIDVVISNIDKEDPAVASLQLGMVMGMLRAHDLIVVL